MPPPSTIPVTVHATPAAAARAVAAGIADCVRAGAAAGRPAVLGLAAGSTPEGVYRELGRLHAEEGLDFTGVRAFGLDEYWPIDPAAPQGFRAFLEHAFARPVGLDPDGLALPNGRTPPERLADECHRYERAIREAGGIDLQLLGIGANGHIAFNEPGSLPGSRTRLVELDEDTRRAAAGAFGGLRDVPRRALTMGVGSILEARRLVLLALGPAKAEAVRRALQEPPSPAVPASFLQEHPSAEVVLDRAAAAGLACGRPE